MRTVMTLSIGTCALMAGCASVPKVSVAYYPPKASTNITITQTIACDAKYTRTVAATSANISTTYASDLEQEPSLIQFSEIDGIFSDSNTTITLTDDRRLKSINASTAGAGAEIVSAGASLLTLAIGAAFVETTEPPEPCSTIAAWGGGKPVSVTLTTAVTYPSNETGYKAAVPKPDQASTALYEALQQYLPQFDVSVKFLDEKGKSAIVYDAGGTVKDKIIPIVLHKNKFAEIAITSGDATIASALVQVPTKEPYTVPIPTSKFFGKQGFSLTLSDSGAITSIGYSKDTGLGAALGAANSVGSAFKPDSTATQAAQLKAEADVIAQQQRLVSCKANPATCAP